MRQGCQSYQNLSKAYLQADWVKICSEDQSCSLLLRLLRHYQRDALMHISRQSTSFCYTMCLQCFLCDLRSMSSSSITNQFWLIQLGKCSFMNILLVFQFYSINDARFSLYQFSCCSLLPSFDISSNSFRECSLKNSSKQSAETKTALFLLSSLPHYPSNCEYICLASDDFPLAGGPQRTMKYFPSPLPILYSISILQQLKLIMKIYSNTLRQLISTGKFYEIVSERKDRNLPKTAEQLIISKFLKSSSTETSEKKQSYAVNEQLALKKSKQINYQQFMKEHPNGSIITESYKNVQLSLVSLNYMNINLPQIYQICEKAQPDLVFVQARPQAYIEDYELLPKNNSVFSDKKYIEQICLNPHQVKQQILNQEIVSKLQHILGKGGKQNNEKVFIRDHKDIVDDEIVMISSYFTSTNGKGLMLGELPQQPWREWLCNSHTLMELTEIFKHITKNIPFYQSLKLSPYKLGALLKPELFLNIRDRYMATLLEMAIATKKHKKILCITGLLQNKAIQHILLNQSLFKNQGQDSEITPVIEYLIGPQIKHSILRNIQGWQIIEKHILLDVLHYGEEILSQPIQTFTTTNKVIAFYGRKVNDYPEPQLMRFRYEKTLAYLSLMRQQILDGRQLKRKFLLREAIRSADV